MSDNLTVATKRCSNFIAYLATGERFNMPMIGPLNPLFTTDSYILGTCNGEYGLFIGIS